MYVETSTASLADLPPKYIYNNILPFSITPSWLAIMLEALKDLGRLRCRSAAAMVISLQTLITEFESGCQKDKRQNFSGDEAGPALLRKHPKIINLKQQTFFIPFEQVSGTSLVLNLNLLPARSFVFFFLTRRFCCETANTIKPSLVSGEIRLSI